MKVPNINCKHYDLYGHCKLQGTKKWWLFNRECVEVDFAVCTDALRYKRKLLINLDKSVKK